jgi:hypothetical protein
MKEMKWKWMEWSRARRGPRTKNLLYLLLFFVLCLYSFVMVFFLFLLMLFLFVKECECWSCRK